jgi:predicted DNA-binding transcriptional regulator AlpA
MRMPSLRLLRVSAATVARPVGRIMREQSQVVRTEPLPEHIEQRNPERLPANGASRSAAIQPGEVLAFSIPEFCRRHGISRAHFYNLSKIGAAPVVMRVGRRTLISAEAAAQWRIRMEDVAATL